jgi:FdhE protein
MDAGTQIRTTADIIKQARPAYAAILDFYSRVFAAQEKSKERIKIPPVQVDPDLLTIRKKNTLPLMDPSEFRIDRDAAVALLMDICDLARAWAPHLAEDAAVTKTTVQDGRIDPDALFSALLDSRFEPLEQTALAVGVSAQHLSMIFLLCMAPSIEIAAQEMKGYLVPDSGLKNRTCPVCGNGPDMGFLDDKGSRHLPRDFFPKLEMAATLHLDMQATEKGYKRQALPT